MGHARKRIGADGKPHYTAYYDDIRGRRRSAGTFATRKRADKAWQRAETKVAEGRAGDPARGRQTFQHYVEHEWLPNHVMEASTREGYTYSIYAHIMDTFGSMKMIEILPSHVREWVTALTAEGMTPATLRSNKSILSAIFTTALNDQVTTQHPCRGVKTPPVPKKTLRIITPEEFDTFYAHLPHADAQLLVETAIESGMRWGELTELRPHDLDLPNHLVTVSRTVVEVNDKFHPDGGNYLVKEYPKDREPRRFKLSAQITAKLREHIRIHAIAPGDLIFSYHPAPSVPRQPLDHTEDLGLTEPNAHGRRYRHGTLSAYSAGPCRCAYCRRAYADYRAQRRAQGNDHPRRPRRACHTDGHIPHRWFRDTILRPALTRSGIDTDVKMHGLRHAHASWLLAGGADLQVVKERLGHASIATTEKYLHTLPDADNTAVDALSAIRRRTPANR
jgi:integrase